jgi:hypothetical protein
MEDLEDAAGAVEEHAARMTTRTRRYWIVTDANDR